MFQTAEKTAWKIVGDPAAPESAWLPACHLTSDTKLARNVGKSEATNRPLLAATALTIALIACVGAHSWVDSGFDWGYFFVKRLVGQPSSPQGMVAAVVSAFLMPPLIYGLFAGQIRAFFAKQKWIAYAPLAATLAYYGWIISHGDEWYRDVPFCIVSLVLTYAAYFVGCKLWRWARSITKAKSLLWVPMLSFGIVGILEFLPSQYGLNALKESVGIQLSIYAAAIWANSFIGGYLSRSRRTATTILFGLAVTLPVVSLMVLNVIGTLVSLTLDPLGLGANIGWRACMSAAVILLVTMCSVITGGFCAGKLRQLRSASHRLEHA